MSLNLTSLFFHVPVFDVPDVSQIDVPFIPCPCIWCSSNRYPFQLMSLYFMSLNQFNVPHIYIPFIPCPCISCPLTNSMSPNFTSLSFHVPVFDVPAVPFIPCPCIWCPWYPSNWFPFQSMSLYFMSINQLHVPQVDVTFIPCPWQSSNLCSFLSMSFILYSLTHSMALKLSSLSIQLLLFEVVQLLLVPHIYVLYKTVHCPPNWTLSYYLSFSLCSSPCSTSYNQSTRGISSTLSMNSGYWLKNV